MSLIELTIIIFISLGVLDREKIRKIFQLFNTSKSDQIRKVIGDETIEQKWIWLEEEQFWKIKNVMLAGVLLKKNRLKVGLEKKEYGEINLNLKY